MQQLESLQAPQGPDISGQTPKLKDTCDRCAASKIRCTKEKPSCARCGKMGLACLYSPARRVGRPYRSTKDSEKHSGPSNMNEGTHIFNVDSEGNLNQITQGHDSPFHQFDSAHRFDSTPSHIDLNANEPNIYNAFQPFQAHEITSGPGMQIHHATSDCMLDILDLFTDLDALEDQIRRSSSIDSSRVDSAKDTITTVFHRLSNVLLCPCSEKAEIGMSMTALCMTIIDIHAMMLNKFSRSRNELTAQDENRWGEHSGTTEEYPDGDALAIKVIGELSEIAKFAVQFNERYSGVAGNQMFANDREIPLDFLPALGRFMSERLQHIANDAMNWPYT